MEKGRVGKHEQRKRCAYRDYKYAPKVFVFNHSGYRKVYYKVQLYWMMETFCGVSRF